MPRPRSRSGYRRSAPRARTGWVGLLTNPATVSFGASALVNLSTELLDALASPLFRQGLTLLRTFLNLRVNSSDATLSTEYTCGLIMGEGDAVSSTANMPSARDDVDAPWLWWERRVALPASDSQQNRLIDVKAKRRLTGNDNALVFIIQNDDPSEALEFSLGCRCLYRLP